MHRFLFLLAVAALVSVPPAFAQTGANVLLVVNEASTDSGRIAEHYARVRGVPPDQVLRLKAAVADEIDRADFNTLIQAPIANWLQRHSAQDRILYIVLTKGIPLRVKGTSGRDGTTASVDSELTLLYQRLTGRVPAIDGRVANPCFLGTTPITEAKPIGRESSDLYLVTRLDGYTVEDVIALIDRAAAPVREGRILLDQKAGPAAAGNEWLASAADRLAKSGLAERVVLETTSRVLTGQTDVLGYYSWGSNDAAITMRHFGFGFVPGAIAGMYVSTDGRTFTEPPAAWTIGRWTDRATFFAGSPQSLAGDLIREGVTGVAAYVDEPYLDASIRPDILFPAYVSGFNLAGVLLPRDALPELADGRRGRPAVRAVPAAGVAAGWPSTGGSTRPPNCRRRSPPGACRCSRRAPHWTRRRPCCDPRRGRRKATARGLRGALEEATALEPKNGGGAPHAGERVRDAEGLRQSHRAVPGGPRREP